MIKTLVIFLGSPRSASAADQRKQQSSPPRRLKLRNNRNRHFMIGSAVYTILPPWSTTSSRDSRLTKS